MNHEPIVAVIDQYEEANATESDLPYRFVERLSLLDREEPRISNTLFIWLTTSPIYQAELAAATRRNRRLLVSADFELTGPPWDQWPGIIEDTFDFHNPGSTLSDHGILSQDLEKVCLESDTIGQAIDTIGTTIALQSGLLQDISQYQVIIVWPVVDAVGLSRVVAFTDPKAGYRLDWTAWYRSLNENDQSQLPLQSLNRARLYYDFRVVPIAAADLFDVRQGSSSSPNTLPPSRLSALAHSHLFAVVSGSFDSNSYRPQRPRESPRSVAAREWYQTATHDPVALERDIAIAFNQLGLRTEHERPIRTRYAEVRADLLVDRPEQSRRYAIVELKAFSGRNTHPSGIRDAIRVVLRRHATLAGFLERQ